MKVLRKEVDIHIPDLRVIIRITDGGIAFFGERVNIRSPAMGDFYLDQDNWIITPDPQGGIALHSADAVTRFYRENRAVNNVCKLALVRSNDDQKSRHSRGHGHRP
ncbi:hypothetical protein CUC53_04655 [Aeromonas cavernicola]|uniref:Uncharacterized protein n=1 Tax=Aeromonas cavernicola TaxID=1006623 RepID=A0A2H9U7E7_9GAMM|nr:hypothetical protein CUC53_04655 [Aeromonas cavernicola]